MAARRCALCGVSYPDIAQFASCPLHGEETARVKGEPDANWQDALARLKAHAEKDAEMARPVPLIHGVEPYVDHGLLWLDQNTLMDAGVRRSRFISFHLLELDDGYIYELQGYDNPRRRWWVERVLESEPAAT